LGWCFEVSDTLGIGQIKLVSEIVSRNWNTPVPEKKIFTYSELLFVLQEMQRDEGREYFAERVGLRGFHIFREFVKMLLYRNLANYDSMVLLTSEKGSGKSSAGLVLCKEWCRLLGRPFIPEKYIAYNTADVMNKIESLEPFSPLLLDESVRFASSAEWNKKENRELRKKLAQVRTKHLFFILCYPFKIQKIEKSYLDSLVNYWCVTKDTRILIKDKRGIRKLPIEELSGHDYEVATYNIETKEIEFKKSEGKKLTKKMAEVYEVELMNGQKIKATAEHQFLTKDGYKKLIDLTDDDEIIVRSKICKCCNKEFVPKREQMIFCSDYCGKKFNMPLEERRKYNCEYRKNNPEKVKQQAKENYEKHKEKRLADAAIYREEKREYINEYAKIYRQENKDYWSRYLKDPNFKIAYTLRTRLRGALKSQKAHKNNSVIEYTGCSIEFLKNYLEDRFVAGMSWDNHGEWHIDHIRPCSSFDLTKEEECKKCFHFSNLLPLWAHDNHVKSDNYDSDKNKIN
jgi:hypothetical protein